MLSKNQLAYYCQRLRNQGKARANDFKLKDFQNLFEAHNVPPNDENAAFIPFCQLIPKSHTNKKQQFRLVITSKQLLSFAGIPLPFHADGTYKVLWMHHPVLIFGTSGEQGDFHPLCVCLVSGETEEDYFQCFLGLKEGFLSAFGEPMPLPSSCHRDGADAISNAMKRAFDGVPQQMCWAHVIRNIDKKLCRVPSELRTKMRRDIVILQLARSPQMFDVFCRHFLRHWEQEDGCDGFLSYFRNEWLDNPNQNTWYNGATDGPDTNNSNESINQRLKEDHTFRRRIVEWSMDRDPNGVDPKYLKSKRCREVWSQTEWVNGQIWSEKKVKLKESEGAHYFFCI